MGGAIFNYGGTITIDSSTFSANTAWGGSSYDAENGSSTFDSGGPGNGYGGAIFNLNGTVTIANSTIVSNTVVAGEGSSSGTATGGGIYSLGDGATTSLTLDNTIAANSAMANSQISNFTVVMGALSSATDVVGNTINGGTNTTAGANNQIEAQTGYSGGIVSTADPDLGPLQDNTGPTYTHAPNIGSPVIDAGNCGSAVTDQRGVTRPLDGEPNGSVLCDIGAIEFNPSLDPVPPGDDDPNLQGDPLRLSDMGPDGDTTYSANRPAVAYNSTNNEYLVVWYGDDDSSPLVDNENEIFGQRVDGTTGAEVGSDFRISDMGPEGDGNYDAFYPRVAYNATDNEYLVVWYADDNSGSLVDNEFEIFGQRLNGATGAEIGSDFRISDMGSTDGVTSYGAQYPDVAWNATNNEYLVVWYGDDDSGSLVDNEFEIYGQRLNAATGAEVGSDFRISDMGSTDGVTSYTAQNARVVWNSTNNEYLVVWYGDDNSGSLVDNEFEIRGQRLNGATGAEVGSNDFRISDMGPDGSTSYGAGGFANPPEVAYNPVENEYLVIWNGDDNTAPLVDNEREIFGQRLNAATGAETGSNDFRISDVGLNGNTSYNAGNNSVAYDAVRHEYLVVWHGDEFRPPLITDNEQEIYGQRLDASTGAEIGDNDFRISQMGPDNNNTYNAFYPAVAANSSSVEYLIVWQAEDDTAPLVDNEFEIFGQRYGVPLPPTPILSISKTASNNNPTSGDVLTYTVVMSNGGAADATAAVVADALPGGLSFVNGSTTLEPAGVGTTGDAPTLVSSLTITAGQMVTVTYQATATAISGQITNTVSVTSSEVTSAVTDSATITVTPPQYALNVTLAGNGVGTVASNPAGIDCGSDCTEIYTYGTVVTLTATYDTGTTTLVWSGGCSAVGSSCSLTLNQTQNVTAGFFIDNTPPDIAGVTLLSPTGTISETQPLFTWTAATDSQSGVISYTLQLSDTNTIQTFAVTGLSYTPATNLADGDYTWTVKAHDAAGNESTYVDPAANFTILTDVMPADKMIFLPLLLK